ncbi:MAG: C4-dicarboxylate ABC transporter permease [Curvibacter sp. RIFCSPHIGHO2_12_FULL_63_18]|uniref:TRAP transporter small permease n=1 Tax=Rhodoferax sp. TaxID=50421 RepID=UPI0008BE68E5|nr:TRAP transporter small permease [Rhodoferax sp.]OGO99572.1 MAG: C4-dicarboxylate ABC transporter permease [Curvibacter sp. GWA2_63_95]OGP03591.1 MAG: C4-dicarboxylate ABC transporter permease [Curvibacter sp. RIFCSPHIGHO2_12_FULL_63_18]
MVNKFINGYCKLLGYLIAAALALMVVLVFGNVVMRYAFNSGFTLSEELSRWLFVWVTFMGAVVALHEKAHLGTDMLVGRLGATGKKVCMALSLVLMLFCLWLVAKGSYDQYLINKESTSPVMEVSMGIFYASGVVFAVLGAPIVLTDLWRLLSGQVDDAHLVLIQESEEAPHGGDSGGHSPSRN